MAPELTEGVSGHMNDGDGLDADGALELANLLEEAVDSGRAKEYEDNFNEAMRSIPDEPCPYCESTGIRKDMFPDKELSVEVAKRLGRTQGWCNGCDGEGSRRPFCTSYRFSVENVVEFIGFLKHSGGFSIC